MTFGDFVNSENKIIDNNPMKHLRKILYVASIVLATSCGSNSTQSNESQSAFSSKVAIASITNEAVKAAQNVIKQEYARDAVFSEAAPLVTETDVDNRYKVQQHFGSVDKECLDLVYTIWVQKLGDNWTYGTLKITTPKGVLIHISEGRMKELEQQEMARIESSKTDGIEYTIIERSAPNFVRISTSKQLSNSEIKNISDKLGTMYESIFFCVNGKNNRGDEYVNVQGNLVFDYRGDGAIKNLEDL